TRFGPDCSGRLRHGACHARGRRTHRRAQDSDRSSSARGGALSCAGTDRARRGGRGRRRGCTGNDATGAVDSHVGARDNRRAPGARPRATERTIPTALEARPEDRYPDLSVMVNDIWGAQAALAEPEPPARLVKPRSPVAVRSRPSRFPLTLGIAGAIAAAGVIAVRACLPPARTVSPFRAKATAPVVTAPPPPVPPPERSPMPPPQPLAPPAPSLQTEPGSVPASAATAAPDGTS